MLRNLNQTGARGRILGTPFRGIKGSAIPSTGTHGPSAIYNDLSLPADANKEYSLRLLTWPASGSLFMYEDGSSVFIPAANGTFTATAMLVEDGVDKASETLTWNSGVGVVTCTVGTASATGAPATVTNSSGGTVVACSVGVASATGAIASIQQGRTIACQVGNAAATGASATITNGTATTLIPNAHQMYIGRTRIRTYIGA